jgi:hypothetical protein
MLAPARAAVEKWLQQSGAELCGGGGCNDMACHGCDRRVLNAGELADSLAWSPEENPHIGMLLDLFSDPETNPHGHKLLLVTKAGLEATRAHLKGRQPSENVILSWSIGNGLTFYEPGCAPVWPAYGRWRTAVETRNLGWRVRWRLDPLVMDHRRTQSVSGHSFDLVANLGSVDTRPELITLGTVRHRGGRPKLPADARVSIYREAIAGLREGGYEGPVGLCKESPNVLYDMLALAPGRMRCNCMP